MSKTMNLKIGFIEPDPTKVGNKCPVMIGEDNKICYRPAIETYRTDIILSDGRKVEQKLHVCKRHKQVCEEFINDQGNCQ